MNLHDRDIQRAAKREGIEEGIRQKAVENAINFLKMNLGTVEQIAKGTGLSVEEVEKLSKSIL